MDSVQNQSSCQPLELNIFAELDHLVNITEHEINPKSMYCMNKSPMNWTENGEIRKDITNK